MSFVSYAQNFEDVTLRRALGDVDRGFYIDIGAFHPSLDSVTRAFYERGWSGINVEPDPESFRTFETDRPRDVNVALAVGARAGTATLKTFEGGGISTLDSEIAQWHDSSTPIAEEIVVDVITLATLWEKHVPAGQDVHFLKIDVEGSERDVIAGNNWRKYRPWIVVVEATLPNRRTPSHDDWDPLLTKAGYKFAYFDELNRFYVAKEHADLAPLLAQPPSIFDDIVKAREMFYRDEAIALRAELEFVAAERDNLQRAYDEIRSLNPLTQAKRGAKAIGRRLLPARKK